MARGSQAKHWQGEIPLNVGEKIELEDFLVCTLMLNLRTENTSVKYHTDGAGYTVVAQDLEIQQVQVWVSVACILSHSSCSWLCDCMDCSPPGSSVHGIFQTRILEWVAISSSRASPLRRDQAHVSCFGMQVLTTESPGKPFEFPLTGSNISTCITGTT